MVATVEWLAETMIDTLPSVGTKHCIIHLIEPIAAATNNDKPTTCIGATVEWLAETC